MLLSNAHYYVHSTLVGQFNVERPEFLVFNHYLTLIQIKMKKSIPLPKWKLRLQNKRPSCFGHTVELYTALLKTDVLCIKD